MYIPQDHEKLPLPREFISFKTKERQIYVSKYTFTVT